MRVFSLLLIALVVALAGCSNDAGGEMMPPVQGQSVNGVPGAMPQVGQSPSSMTSSLSLFPPSRPGVLPANVMRSCAKLLDKDQALCYAVFRTDVGGGFEKGDHSASPSSKTINGYHPADLQSAYNLPSSTAGKGQAVAIVDAYDDPDAEADLGVYRSAFGLPDCTTANGCFQKVNQDGKQQDYPPANGGWAQEESLDLDMVSAICPNCHIILVEATNATFANLGAAVDEAVKLGANVVSNSYGGSESDASNPDYSHPGHVITASSGDGGYGAAQPCSYSTVVCTGGTTLQKATNARGWAETAWNSAGSGCSTEVPKPVWQTDRGCMMRSESDISAVADPNTGVAVYDSYTYQNASGWLVFGGTSASSPIIAAVFALAGNASSVNAAQGIWMLGGTSAFFDVTSGSNGTCPSTYTYICNAGAGYDGPTGWGTPDGVMGF